jgi:hypothetical protein
MGKGVQFYVWLPFKVELTQPAGHPGNSFFVSINGYHYGAIEKINGQWMPLLSPNAWKSLTIEDIIAMGERIDEEYPSDGE